MLRRGLFTVVIGLLACPAIAQQRQTRRPTDRPRPAPARPAAARRPPRPALPPRAAPAIDPAPTPSRTPGFDPAPVPRTDLRPPLVDTQPRATVRFGVPTPPEPQQGLTFRSGDPSVESRQGEQGASGVRVPSPGATVRLPF